MSEEELYDKIHDYIAGNLNEKEASALAARIAGEESVGELYQMARLELDMANVLLDEHLEEQITEWEKSKQSSSNRRSKRILLGLVALLLLFLGLFFLSKQLANSHSAADSKEQEITKPSSEDVPPLSLEKDTIAEKTLLTPDPESQEENRLDNQNTTTTTPDEMPIATAPVNKPEIKVLALAYAVQERPFSKESTRTTNTNSSTITLNNVISAAANNELEQALYFISVILQDSTQQDLFLEAQQFQGFITFQQGEYAKAIQLLTPILNKGVGRTVQTKWCLALAHLASDQPVIGKQYLRQLQAIPSLDDKQRQDVEVLLIALEAS